MMTLKLKGEMTKANFAAILLRFFPYDGCERVNVPHACLGEETYTQNIRY
jgi:hypothetical protein